MIAEALTALALVAPAHAREGCNTQACETRVYRKRTIRPYRAWLARTRQCESGGRWHIATGNGFYGAYQFTKESWEHMGGTGMPHEAPPEEQDRLAKKLMEQQGPQAWPNCA